MIYLQKSNSVKENKEHNTASLMYMFLLALNRHFAVQIWIAKCRKKQHHNITTYNNKIKILVIMRMF